MKKHVVTGGAGFIGSALVRALLEKNSGEVVIIDNLLTGKRENLAELAGPVELHTADIRSYADIAPLVKGADTVFHLAAIPSVPRSIDRPCSFTRSEHRRNVSGAESVPRRRRAACSLCGLLLRLW